MARNRIARRTVFPCLSTAFGVPACGHAHEGSSAISGFQWTAWNFEPWVLFCLALSAGLFVAGLRRLWPKVGTGRRVLIQKALAYAGGWLLIALALISPLDRLSNELFSAHMVQHEILILLAAPLLVLSRPIAFALWAFPRGWRKSLTGYCKTGWVGRFWRRMTVPLAAWTIHGAVIWIWHAPVFFQAALRHEDVHTLQHLSFFVSALVFWWAIIRGGEGARGYGAGVLYVFSTTVHTSLLGALLTFSSQPWYPTYGGSAAAGLSALEDQQLAGLIMWVPAGAIYLVIALGMFAAWLEAIGKNAGGAAGHSGSPLPRGP
ncbi:cytochrome c oxidase assembly protein [Methylocaldum sp. GT1TLB]|uniref:cytochrome c oxidase assembly protein n=1 Tax=Methylocaldum sp. GT1TLB TaxID=3438965 RepID=UPI003DA0B5D0